MKHQAVTDGASNTSAVARHAAIAIMSVALRWEEEGLAQMRSTSLLAAQGAGSRSVTRSSCIDGARVGRPASEYLVQLLWDHKEERTIVAPPQVLVVVFVCASCN